jgi:hypothetical protein
VLESDESPTPYVKGSKAKTPAKADHKHEYVRIVAWNYLRRFDGTITTKKYKLSKPATCIDCGHINRKAYKEAVEVEVSVKEYRAMDK